MQTSVSSAQESRSPARRLRGWRRVVFPLLAVLLALTPFVVLECVLIAFGVGGRGLLEDPLAGFAGNQPLFELDERGEIYRTARRRRLVFAPQEFAREKPHGTFRIFGLGGSTVQGRPFAIETSFTTWLEIALRGAEPARTWEVINCGGISYASYRLVPILEEVLGYDPDLIVLYTGHNEFYGPGGIGSSATLAPSL